MTKKTPIDIPAVDIVSADSVARPMRENIAPKRGAGFFLAVDALPVPESPSDDMGNLVHGWLDEPRWSPVLGQWYGKRSLKLGDFKQLAFGIAPGAGSLRRVTFTVELAS